MTENHRKARESLETEEQQKRFDDLVTDYRFVSESLYGRAYISYPVIAELVKHGWSLKEKIDATDHS